MKRYFLNRAREKILIVDSSKFGIKGLHIIANVEDFDVIITDNKIGKKYLSSLEKLEIKLEIIEL